MEDWSDYGISTHEIEGDQFIVIFIHLPCNKVICQELVPITQADLSDPIMTKSVLNLHREDCGDIPYVLEMT